MMQYPIPEMSLDPPEAQIVGWCPVCGGEIYAGDAVWAKDGDIVCEWHLGPEVAHWSGYHKEVAQNG